MPRPPPPARPFADEVGRDPTTRDGTVTILTADGAAGPWWDDMPFSKEYEPITPMMGGPAEIAEELRAYRREGVTHVQINMDAMTTKKIGQFAPALELLKKD